MKSKLRVVEVRKDKLVELPDGAIPLRLEQVVEPTGLVNQTPSSERFMLYYLEKERGKPQECSLWMSRYSRRNRINTLVENTPNPF